MLVDVVITKTRQIHFKNNPGAEQSQLLSWWRWLIKWKTRITVCSWWMNFASFMVWVQGLKSGYDFKGLLSECICQRERKTTLALTWKHLEEICSLDFKSTTAETSTTFNPAFIFRFTTNWSKSHTSTQNWVVMISFLSLSALFTRSEGAGS